MTKSELIAILAEKNPYLYHRDIERIVNCFFDTITDALARGDRVELRGFGAFSVRHREARRGRNPAQVKALMWNPKLFLSSKWVKECAKRLNK